MKIKNKKTADQDQSRRIIYFDALGIYNVLSLGRYKYNAAQPALEEHTHADMMEICYCSKGEQVYEVNNDLYFVKGGDIFVTFPGEPHSTAGYPEEKGQLYWLIFKPIASEKEHFIHFSGAAAVQLSNSIRTLSKRQFPGTLKMKSILDRVIAFYDQPSDKLRHIKICNLLTSFLLEVIQSATFSAEKQLPESLLQLLNYIDEDLSQQFHISDLAQRVNLSESRFKSWFKELMGVPPSEYVLKKKIKCSIDLLVNKHMSISEVAYKMGFSSPQHYSNIFKKIIGKLPSIFLKK